VKSLPARRAGGVGPRALRARRRSARRHLARADGRCDGDGRARPARSGHRGRRRRGSRGRDEMSTLHEAPTHGAVRRVVDGRVRRLPGEARLLPVGRRCQSRCRSRRSPERTDVEQRQRDLNEERGDRDRHPGMSPHVEPSAPAGHRAARRRSRDQSGADDTRTLRDGQGDGRCFTIEYRRANMPPSRIGERPSSRHSRSTPARSWSRWARVSPPGASAS